jgi:hypothetical protein
MRLNVLLVEHGIRRAMNVILQGDGTPYGVLFSAIAHAFLMKEEADRATQREKHKWIAPSHQARAVPVRRSKDHANEKVRSRFDVPRS